MTGEDNQSTQSNWLLTESALHLSSNKETTDKTQEALKETAAELQKLKTTMDIKVLQQQMENSTNLSKYIGEIEQAIQTKNQQKKADLLKRFKETPSLQTTLEQNVHKLTSSPKTETKEPTYTTSELLQIQLYGHLFLNEQVSIDGSKGPQTNLVMETLQEKETTLDALTKKITNILQHYPKSPLRKNSIQKLLQEAKQTLSDPKSWGVDQRRNDQQLQQIIQKKQQKAKLTQEEIVMFQVYGNVFFDETISVDGIEGGQTRDIQTVLTGQGPLTERAKQWKENEKSEPPNNKKSSEKAPLSKSSEKSASQTTLQSVNIHSLVESNSALHHLVFNKETSLPPAQAMKAVEQVFTYLTKYLDHTTKEQKNFLQDFTIDLNQGVKVVGNKLEIGGFLKNGAYKETPISFSYDMHSGNFAINTLLQYTTDAKAFNINASQPNKVLFTLPSFQELDTSKNLSFLEISPIIQQEMELNIEKNRAISTVLDLFHLHKQPPQYTEKNSPWIYHLFQLLEHSLTTLEECRNFREEMQRLYTLIGGKMKDSLPEETGKPLEENRREEHNISEQQDKKLSATSPLLGELFNSQKRVQDSKEIWTQNDAMNGLYLFLKRATPEIRDLTSTADDEHQKIDLKEISTYLSFIEKGKEGEYTGFITRT